ncbi:hypothetical protein sp82g_5 [Bacillus phage SP82G]|nr:hypothetical protein sp82g_5 [Bacillus phage SP82G]
MPTNEKVLDNFQYPMTKWNQQYREQGGAYMSDIIIPFLTSAVTAFIVAYYWIDGVKGGNSNGLTNHT